MLDGDSMTPDAIILLNLYLLGRPKKDSHL